MATYCEKVIELLRIEEKNQIMVKQLKNRYNDLTMNRKFVLGIDRAKMRLFDVEDMAQDLIRDVGDDVGTTTLQSGWSI